MMMSFPPTNEQAWTFGSRQHRPLCCYHSSSSIGGSLFSGARRTISNHQKSYDHKFFAPRSPMRQRRNTSQSLRFVNADIRKLSGCAHFHYQMVELGPILVIHEPIGRQSICHPCDMLEVPCWRFRVESNGRSWIIQRNYRQLIDFDRQLHRCVFDRRYSRLREFAEQKNLKSIDLAHIKLDIESYMRRFSDLAGSLITCYPVLKWLELDSRGNRFMAAEETPINTPALAAAYVIREHKANACDELSLRLGDIVSVIEMPHNNHGGETWWKGKLTITRHRMTTSDSGSEAFTNENVESPSNFEVGYFPRCCVQLFGAKTPTCEAAFIDHSDLKGSHSDLQSQHLGDRKGKVMAFMRDFLKSRPPRRKLKEDGILKERVFGCDLSEYLENSALEIPTVVRSCIEAIEKNGVVSGIYRLSGIKSNILKLRLCFDEGAIPNLEDTSIIQDINCISSLLKQYFRELPNPLFTYQLYSKFAEALTNRDNLKMNLSRVKDLINQLPPPHFRTSSYLVAHLWKMISFCQITDMTARNLAIVWAPNLFKAPPNYDDPQSNPILSGLKTQTDICDFIISHAPFLFDLKEASVSIEQNLENRDPCPSNRLIDLSEAQRKLQLARSVKIPSNTGLPDMSNRNFTNLQNEPPKQFHTVIDLQAHKKKRLKSGKTTPVWKLLFTSKTNVSASSTASTDDSRSILEIHQKGWEKRTAQLRRRAARRNSEEVRNRSPNRFFLRNLGDNIRSSKMRSVRSAESLITRNIEENATKITNLSAILTSNYQRQERPVSMLIEFGAGENWEKDQQNNHAFSPLNEVEMPFMETDFDSESPLTKQFSMHETESSVAVFPAIISPVAIEKPRPNLQIYTSSAPIDSYSTSDNMKEICADPVEQYVEIGLQKQQSSDIPVDVKTIVAEESKSEVVEHIELNVHPDCFPNPVPMLDDESETISLQTESVSPPISIQSSAGASTADDKNISSILELSNIGSTDDSSTSKTTTSDVLEDMPKRVAFALDSFTQQKPQQNRHIPPHFSWRPQRSLRILPLHPSLTDISASSSICPPTPWVRTSSCNTFNNALQSLENLAELNGSNRRMSFGDRSNHRHESSGSAESGRLELSRYDNVSPSPKSSEENEMDPPSKAFDRLPDVPAISEPIISAEPNATRKNNINELIAHFDAKATEKPSKLSKSKSVDRPPTPPTFYDSSHFASRCSDSKSSHHPVRETLHRKSVHVYYL